jgi:hypothetical protein
MLQYSEFIDSFYTYVNVYESLTFKLLYSHRVAPPIKQSNIVIGV